MIEGKIPYRSIIYVCTNTRDGRAACGNSERGESCGTAVLDALKEEVKMQGLQREIRVARSGCMDLCGTGPNVLVLDVGHAATLLTRVAATDIRQIIDKFIRRAT